MWEWEDHLNEILLTKPAEVVQEACQVLEKHGCSVKELKSEFYYSSTLCQALFRVLRYANLQSGWSYRNRVVISPERVGIRHETPSPLCPVGVVWSCDHVWAMFNYTTHVVMHREGVRVRVRVQVAGVVTCVSILHPGMSSGPGSTQIHGLTGDTFTSPEYSTDSVDSQSHTKLSSEDVEEESKHQGSKVSNARPFTHKSLVPTHQDVTCAFFSPPMQVPSEPARGESDPHEEPEPATVKGECRVAVCLSMLIPTTNMRSDADMLHFSLPTLTTAYVSLAWLYLCLENLLDLHDGTVCIIKRQIMGNQ